MGNYISLPHRIEAFRFTGSDFKPPKWFVSAYKIGKVSFTINDKEQYISVFGDNQFERAYLQDWVCLSDSGKIFVLDDNSFKNTFRKTD